MGRIAALAPGVAVALATGGLAAGALAALTGAAGGLRPAILAEPYVLAALRFTLLQAALSTLLSLALGAALALALARRRFPGRDALARALSASMVFPTIVAVFGIVAVHGRAGFVPAAAQAAGLEAPAYLYGLTGVLLAHVFFNAPFAARLYLSALETVPAAQWRIAASLDFSARAAFRLIDAPALARVTPQIAGLVFMLCATSFAPVLALGGGPAAATLEVAIYEALRFEFDLPRAATLALAQIALAFAALAIAAAAPAAPQEAGTGTRAAERTDRAALSTRLLDTLAFALAFAVVAAPVLGVLAGGLDAAFGPIFADRAFWRALATSLTIGLGAGLLASAAALALASAATRLDAREGRRGLAQAMTAPAALILAVPPFALATGLFILLRPLAPPAAFGPPLVALVNALAALPFALRALAPALAASAARHDRLALSLGIEGWRRLKLIDWPLLRRPLGLALATATALSLGDMGVAALFGGGEAMTLPVLVYAELAAYRMDRAAAAMIALIALTAALFVGLERAIGGRHAPSP